MVGSYLLVTNLPNWNVVDAQDVRRSICILFVGIWGSLDVHPARGLGTDIHIDKGLPNMGAGHSSSKSKVEAVLGRLRGHSGFLDLPLDILAIEYEDHFLEGSLYTFVPNFNNLVPNSVEISSYGISTIRALLRHHFTSSQYSFPMECSKSSIS